MYMYMCLAVFSFLWRGGRRGGQGGGCGAASRPRLCASWFYGVGVYGWLLASFELRWSAVGSYHALRDVGVVQSTTGFSPPKFSFTPEPVYLNTERRRQSTVPFSGHCPMRSGDAAQAVVCVEESTRLGCVFFRFLCVSRRDGLSVADVYGFATTCVEAWLLPLMFPLVSM
jgi:hypothetical protein